MRLESVRVRHTNPLIELFFRDFTAVEKFFTYNPYRREEFFRRYRYLQENWPPSWGGENRHAMVDALRDYNLTLGCGQATLENLDRLGREETVCIITGQQAGILTGPLYTVYKIITALQLAKDLTDQGIPAVPVFWVASEDHDFDEINHLFILNKENVLQKLKLDEEPAGKYSIGSIPLTAEAAAIIEELAAQTIDTEFKEEILNTLKEMASKADNLAHWFALIISKLFDSYGLILFDPMRPALRQLAKGAFEGFIKNIEPINQGFQQGAQFLVEQGFTPQVEKGDDQTNLFVYYGQGTGERLPLLVKDGRFNPKGYSEVSWSKEELLAMIRENPQSFSPNVILRPLTQDSILPNLAYIGGPGEIAYYAQFKGVYEAMGLEMPIIYPRVNITLVEKPIANYLLKYDLTPGEVFDGRLKVRENEYLAAVDKVNLDELFAGMRDTFNEVYKEVIHRLVTIDPNLKNIGVENQKRILHQVEQLEGKARQYHRKNSGEAIRQFEKIALNLVPEGRWQERKFNIFPYLIKYGPEIIKGMMNLSLLEEYDHKLIFLGQVN